MKSKLLHLSLQKYPEATIVGFTTSAAVMKINSALGFHVTSCSEMARIKKSGMAASDILERTGHQYCLFTAMEFTGPVSLKRHEQSRQEFSSEEFY